MFSMDASEAAAALGVMNQMAMSIETDRFKRSVISYAHAEMAHAFDLSISQAAQQDPAKYHHVFEWRMVGNPAGKLWKHKLTGRGGNREAHFTWKASKAPILTPQERYSGAYSTGEDAIRKVSPKVISKLSKRTYFFYWKAPVMEYNVKVDIAPKWAKKLFVPVRDNPRGYIFTRHVSNFTPGGSETTGAFSTYWTMWWQDQAQAIFDAEIRRTIERDLGRIEPEKVAAKYRKTQVKSFSLAGGNVEYAKAYKDGEEYASYIIDNLADEYEKRGLDAGDIYDDEEWTM